MSSASHRLQWSFFIGSSDVIHQPERVQGPFLKSSVSQVHKQEGRIQIPNTPYNSMGVALKLDMARKETYVIIVVGSIDGLGDGMRESNTCR
ncbi:hypothetical protein K1719_035981 [Acacia pycnantha]|nr:hypothetical protein K1719_035981 [Acacia pycnantha]